MKYYGFSACEALWRNRATDIVRVYLTEDRLKELGPLLKWCAKQKKAYHVVTPADMERIAASVHHEGVTLVARESRRITDEDLAAEAKALPRAASLLYLDGVQNPHNVGSITRVAAHFGVPLVLGREGQLPRLTASAARVAEGGIEYVTYGALTNPAAAFATLRAAGFQIITTSSHASESLYSMKLPARVVFALGGETAGVSRELIQASDRTLAIPGTGTVESLNVAVATGLVLGEYWRQQRERP